MMLSAETQCAIQILGESLELTVTILCSNLLCNLFFHRVSTIHFQDKRKGVTCFLSGKLSQDPLEKFFGCQRQKGRANENPTASEFLKNSQSLRVIDSICIQHITG